MGVWTMNHRVVRCETHRAGASWDAFDSADSDAVKRSCQSLVVDAQVAGSQQPVASRANEFRWSCRSPAGDSLNSSEIQRKSVVPTLHSFARRQQEKRPAWSFFGDRL